MEYLLNKYGSVTEAPEPRLVSSIMIAKNNVKYS